MGLRKFCSEKYAAPWQFGRRETLGLLVAVVGLVLFAAAFAVAHLLHVIDGAGQPHPSVVATLLLELSGTLISAFGVCSYIYVASQASRPHILHIYGLMLFLRLMHSSSRPLTGTFELMGEHLAFSLVIALMYTLSGIRWVLFCKVVTEKLRVLGPPPFRCGDVKLWGKGLTASIILTVSSGTAAWLLAASNLARGRGWEELFAVVGAVLFPPRFTANSQVSIADQIGFCVAINLGSLGTGLVLVGALVYIFIAWRLIRGVLAALEVRDAPKELLAKVRWTLRKHLLGVVLNLSTTALVIVTALITGARFVGERVDTELVAAAVNALDAVADVVGILFLSDIGTLLVHEDPKAGDINRNIRSLLQAAVLSGRTPFAFEGQVIPTASRRCIVSFPGKFSEEWKDMTWQSERHEVSTACVFLPESDPHQRFGKHTPCPETPGACWCLSLYGAEKPWGCCWFPVWEANVQKAVKLGLELVVVFFPGQVGQGVVEWDSLPHVDLWEGRGLGGSQKGEAAYLARQGISFTSEDVDVVRSWLLSTPGCGRVKSRRKATK